MNEPHTITNLCAVYRALWDREFAPKRCVISKVDMRAAKDLLALNPELEVGVITEAFPRYARDEYWRAQGCPAGGLFRNLSRYQGRPAAKPWSNMIACSSCGTTHHAEAPCPLPANVKLIPIEEAINGLVQHFSANHKLPRQIHPRHAQGDR